MKNRFRGFTIPELLVFLTIVGVIGSMLMVIVKPNERYLPYAYYSAYEALNTAVFNIKEDARDNASLDDDDIKNEDKIFPGANIVSKQETSNLQSGLQFNGNSLPGISTAQSKEEIAARELCKKLAVDSSTGDDYGYINTSEYNCKTFNLSASGGGLTQSHTPAFVATNSMTFYISPLIFIESVDATIATEEDAEVAVGSFVVWVDLNGKRGPNTSVWEEKKPADRVPFLVTTSGVVIPVGAPTVDPRYSTSRVQYASDSLIKYSNVPITFLEAQYKAYNGKEYPTFDELSLSSSVRTKFSRTMYKNLDNLIKNTPTTVDDKCKVDKEATPNCSVSLDENKGL